jgi:hypothetical protein
LRRAQTRKKLPETGNFLPAGCATDADAWRIGLGANAQKVSGFWQLFTDAMRAGGDAQIHAIGRLGDGLKPNPAGRSP